MAWSGAGTGFASFIVQSTFGNFTSTVSNFAACSIVQQPCILLGNSDPNSVACLERQRHLGARSRVAHRRLVRWHRLAIEMWETIPEAPLSPRAPVMQTPLPTGFAVWSGVSYDRSVTILLDGALFDSKSRAWTPIPEAPLPRRTGFAFGAVGSALLAWGGSSPPRPNVAHDVYRDGAIYLPDKGRWEPVSPAPICGRSSAQVISFQNSGDVIIWGGFTLDGLSLADGARYAIGSEEWHVLPRLPVEQGTPLVAHALGRRVVLIPMRHAFPTATLSVVSDHTTVPQEATPTSPLPLPSGCVLDPATHTYRIVPFPDEVVVSVAISSLADESLIAVDRSGATTIIAMRESAARRHEGLPIDRGSNIEALAPLGRSAVAIVSNAPARGQRTPLEAWHTVGERWDRLPEVPVSPRQGALVVSNGDELFLWGGLALQPHLSPLRDGAVLRADHLPTI